MLQECQNGELEILKEIDRICKEQNITYFVAYGTLIGAVRHKGFIPWDDDVDIMMPKHDYDRFIEYTTKNADKLKPFELFNMQTHKDYPYMISRYCDNRYYLNVDNEDDCGMGLFVDIYPLEGAGNSVKEFTKKKNKSSRYASLVFLSTRQKVKRENTKSFIKYLIKYPAFLFSKCLGKNFFVNKLNKIADTCDYDNSKFIGPMTWASDDGIKGIFPKKWFSETITVEINGYSFSAPKEYDKILKRLYGDYMQLPPKEQQIAHHYYDAYRK